MASKRSIALFDADPAWRDIFALQQCGHFAPAIELLRNVNTQDVPASLLARIYMVQLQFMLSAGRGFDENEILLLKDVVSQAKKYSYYDIIMEAWLVCYDILVAYRQWSSERLSECVRELVKLEPQLDSYTGRRWLRRKAGYLRKCGQLNEASALLLQLIRNPGPGGREESDNSLCIVYYELARLQTQVGKYQEAAETYTAALSVAFSIPNRSAILLRLCNVLERIGNFTHAEARRVELFNLYGSPMNSVCKLCTRPLNPEGKMILPCCREVVHCECLVLSLERQATPHAHSSSARCPGCGDISEITDIFLQFSDIRRRLVPLQMPEQTSTGDHQQ